MRQLVRQTYVRITLSCHIIYFPSKLTLALHHGGWKRVKQNVKCERQRLMKKPRKRLCISQFPGFPSYNPANEQIENIAELVSVYDQPLLQAAIIHGLHLLLKYSLQQLCKQNLAGQAGGVQGEGRGKTCQCNRCRCWCCRFFSTVVH